MSKRLRAQLVGLNARPGGLCHHEIMAHEFTTSYLKDSLAVLRQYKKMGEAAMAQVGDEHMFALLDSESNSIALIVKHMAGNMRSRWTDFLTSDGEKPDRNRDTEFVDPPSTRQGLMQVWEHGWACVLGALEPLAEADLGRTVYIRGEAHSVMQAINRQMMHYAGHCGQIVLLAKHYSRDQWQSLTIPKKPAPKAEGQ
jgi:hypothetical protein